MSKYLDEIAANICEAKIKISDISALIDFCVRVASLYSNFPDILTAELRKNLPCKKTSVISNPSKLRVDLRCFFYYIFIIKLKYFFLTDSCLNLFFTAY